LISAALPAVTANQHVSNAPAACSTTRFASEFWSMAIPNHTDL
jgi:hypothetical protein